MVSTKQVQLAIGRAIRCARKDGGYSQEDFALRCGIDRSFMGKVERGEDNFSLDTLLKICRGLGAQPSELFKVSGY